MNKPPDSFIQRRITIVLLFFFIALGALLGRLFILQIVYHKEYSELAAKQQRFIRELLPERGNIFAQNREGQRIPLALNRTYKTLIASPRDIENIGETTQWLIQEFKLPAEDVIRKLSRNDDPYEVLLKKIEPEAVRIHEGKMRRGIFFQEERRRFYPYGTLGAHLLGFVSQEHDAEEGRYGLERSYEEHLAGKKGFFEGAKDAAGFWVALGKRITNPPRDGADLVLTIDYNIQQKADEVFKAVSEKWQTHSGLVLILEPKTGRILALSVSPTFDPNEFGKENDFSVFLNPAVESSYELGSVMKPITLAGALGEHLIDPESTYEDKGEVKIGGYIIKNFDERAYRVQTMTQVLEKSLNTGAVHAAKLLGEERHLDYLKKFGFGEKTGVDLPGEVQGNISHLSLGRDIDFATASFGQGIAVTPLQIASAMGAIANGGKLMRPYVVEKILDDSGNEIQEKPQIIREVLSPDAADKLTKMLVSAVRNGFENKAGVKGYFVAGKTGTAQIPRRDRRGYYFDRVIHSFVGYAPAFDPKFLILLQLNEPRGNLFAANTLTPAFHDLAEYILNYYEIPPDEK